VDPAGGGPEDCGNPTAELRDRMNDRLDERLDKPEERVRQLLEARGGENRGGWSFGLPEGRFRGRERVESWRRAG